MEYNFKQFSGRENNIVVLEVEFMDGDGDFYMTDEFNVGITYYDSMHLVKKCDKLEKDIKKWKTLQEISNFDYEEDMIESEYGEEIANFYKNNIPYSSLTFGQNENRKKINSLTLVYYNNGNIYKSNIY